MKQLYHYAILMRLHKPVGILLLLWPTLMALWLASQGQPDWRLVVIFSFGVIVMRSFGCVINDLADRKFDGHVCRTQQRPLVTGAVSVKEAMSVCIVLLLMAILLVSFTDRSTIALSLIALLLATAYPFMKRYTHFPQLVLGAAFAWAIPMAYMAQKQALSLDCWLLYGATLLWAMVYDTIYAMVDREDDIRIGVKSTAIFFASYDQLSVFICQLGMLLLLVGLGQYLNLNAFFQLSLLIVFILDLYQQWLIRNRDPKGCFKAFLNNQWVGAVLFLGVIGSIPSFCKHS